VKEVEITDKNSFELNDNADEQQDSLTLWTVAGMLLIWIYVIMMSLF